VTSKAPTPVATNTHSSLDCAPDSRVESAARVNKAPLSGPMLRSRTCRRLTLGSARREGVKLP
jgi:hypothetical protein